MSLSKWLSGGHIGFFVCGLSGYQIQNGRLACFRTLSCGFISLSTPIISSTLVESVARSLLFLTQVQLRSTRCLLLPHPPGRGFPSISLICNFISKHRFRLPVWWVTSLSEASPPTYALTAGTIGLDIYYCKTKREWFYIRCLTVLVGTDNWVAWRHLLCWKIRTKTFDKNMK